jgi:hypothetical protein
VSWVVALFATVTRLFIIPVEYAIYLSFVVGTKKIAR